MAGSIGRRSVLRMGLGAGLASALQACGGGGPSETVVAVGTVEGTDAFIGLVFDSTGVNVYVCDSETISAWFQGNVEDGTVEIDNGTAKLRAEVDDDGASGTFTDAAGVERSFSAIKATGSASIWFGFPDGEDGNQVAGWVVDADGEQRGALQDRTSRALISALSKVDITNGNANIASVDFIASSLLRVNDALNAYL